MNASHKENVSRTWGTAPSYYYLSEKIRKAVAKWNVCNLIALIFGWNSVKGLRVTKVVKDIKFEGVWGELESKNISRDSYLQNIYDKKR